MDTPKVRFGRYRKADRPRSITSKCWAGAFALLTLIGFGQALAGPLEDAKTAYDKKDYTTALSLWSPLALAGNAEAQRGLGILYENGLSVARDGRQAVDWFRKAASQGDAEAEYRRV
jgi:TPR repeat protein